MATALWAPPIGPRHSRAHPTAVLESAAALLCAASGEIVAPVTFSIVARDQATGDLGVATMSFALAVGVQVPVLGQGGGAAAAQAWSPPEWRDMLSRSLASGLSADAVLQPLTSLPPADVSQVIIVDARGRTA